MLTRIRWFIYGAVATFAVTVMAVQRARLLRERLDADGIRRIAVSYGADAMRGAGRYLQNSVPDTDTTPDGGSNG